MENIAYLIPDLKLWRCRSVEVIILICPIFHPQQPKHLSAIATATDTVLKQILLTFSPSLAKNCQPIIQWFEYTQFTIHTIHEASIGY